MLIHFTASVKPIALPSTCRTGNISNPNSNIISVPVIVSYFIFRINLTEFAHVYKERGEHGAANPEVKECAEQCLALITSVHNQFNKDLMLAIKN